MLFPASKLIPLVVTSTPLSQTITSIPNQQLEILQKTSSVEAQTNKESKKTFLVSMTLGKSAKKNESSLIVGSEKQYKCSWHNKQQQEVDENCEIQTLNYASATKASSVQNVISYSLSLKSTSELKEKSLYKLMINDHDGFSPIFLSKKSNNEIIATLTNKFSIEEKQITGKTDLILGRIDHLNTNAPKIETCFVGKKKVNCKAYSWGNYIGRRQKAKDFDYKQLQAIKTEKNTCVKGDKYCGLFVLKLEEPIFDLSSNKQIKVIVNETNVYLFQSISPLAGFINGRASNIIYMNNNHISTTKRSS